VAFQFFPKNSVPRADQQVAYFAESIANFLGIILTAVFPVLQDYLFGLHNKCARKSENAVLVENYMEFTIDRTFSLDRADGGKFFV